MTPPGRDTRLSVKTIIDGLTIVLTDNLVSRPFGTTERHGGESPVIGGIGCRHDGNGNVSADTKVEAVERVS
jgi:hypothetical protein